MKKIKYRHKGGIKYSFNAPEPFIIDDELYYYEGFSGDVFSLNVGKSDMEMRYWWDLGKYTPNAFKEDSRKYNKVFPFLHMLKFGSVIYADVLFRNEEYSLFYDIDTGKTWFFRTFAENFKFKASKMWDGCLYMVVESEHLRDFAAIEPTNSNTCIIKQYFVKILTII